MKIGFLLQRYFYIQAMLLSYNLIIILKRIILSELHSARDRENYKIATESVFISDLPPLL